MAELPSSVTLGSQKPAMGYFTDTHVSPTSSGQYAVSMFDKYTAPEYAGLHGGMGAPPLDRVKNRLNKFNVNDATVFVTNDKPMVDNYGNVTNVKETLKNDFWGSRTGKDSGGIREIASSVKNKASALPRNELLSMKGYTPELNQQYGRIAKKIFPQRYFQGREGGNYVAPQGMASGVMKWLSKILPGANLTSIPQAAGLYDNIKKEGMESGYLRWLGMEPTKQVY